MSGSHKGDSRGAPKGKRRAESQDGEKRGRKQRSGDVGRALRSVYDDTLREAVPDDFVNLLGKLS